MFVGLLWQLVSSESVSPWMITGTWLSSEICITCNAAKLCSADTMVPSKGVCRPSSMVPLWLTCMDVASTTPEQDTSEALIAVLKFANKGIINSLFMVVVTKNYPANNVSKKL